MSQSPDSVDVPSYAGSEPSTSAVVSPPAEPAKLGPLARLTGVLFSPGETFHDIGVKPTVIFPIIISILLSIGGYYFFMWRAQPNMDAIIAAQVKKGPGGQNMNEEQVQQAVQRGKSWSKVITPIFLVAGPAILAFFLAGLYALGMMMIQAKTTFMKIVSVVSWTYASVGIVGLIVTVAVLMVQDTETLKSLDPSRFGNIVPTNLGSLVDVKSSALRSLLTSIDVFSIWRIILLSIGLAAIAGSKKVKSSKTAMIVVSLWVVGVLIGVGWASIFG
jgi:hypothetical protein